MTGARKGIDVVCDPDRCTGCGACYICCPQGCIEMSPDEDGFLRPVVDSTRCVGCGHCRKACPECGKPSREFKMPAQVLACWHVDDRIRLASSSGGAFSALAEIMLQKGGLVAGAAYDEDGHVRHILVRSIDDLSRLRKSKYVQSDVPEVLHAVKRVLNQGRDVLFVGTPCQVAGLYGAIGTEPDSLITCDLLCHGVPSPRFWRAYLDFLTQSFGEDVFELDFRDKAFGWERGGVTVLFQDGRRRPLWGREKAYVRAFYKGMSLRPCCYSCRYKRVARVGDISLGDFWGIGRFGGFRHATRKGVSLVMVNTEKGNELLSLCRGKLVAVKRPLEEALAGNAGAFAPTSMPDDRNRFYADAQRMRFGNLAVKYGLDGRFPQLWGLLGRMGVFGLAYWIHDTARDMLRRVTGR